MVMDTVRQFRQRAAAARRQQLLQQGLEVRRVLPGDDQVPAQEAVLQAMGTRGLASLRRSPSPSPQPLPRQGGRGLNWLRFVVAPFFAPARSGPSPRQQLPHLKHAPPREEEGRAAGTAR